MDKTVLHWSYRNFKEFPADLKNLDAVVEEVYLKENHISAIPKWFLCNVNLKFIHLAGNHIKRIPEDIGLLCHLEFLDLSDNHLEELPKSIWRLSRLSDLNVSCNSIQYVPAEIGRLKNLQVLNLRDNLIRSLPVEIGSCINLEGLIVSENLELYSIPEIVANLPKLKAFCADRCGLLYLPGILSESIKYLNIFNNPFTHTPEPYLRFFERYYEVHDYPENLRKKGSPLCFTLREKTTNRFFRLSPLTKKVLCCFTDRQHVFTLFEQCLRSIHGWTVKRVQFDTACLPENLKEYLRNGPISKCLHQNCNSPLFCEYFLLIFSRQMRDTFFTATFCSKKCGISWMASRRMETFISGWEVCQN